MAVPAKFFSNKGQKQLSTGPTAAPAPAPASSVRSTADSCSYTATSVAEAAAAKEAVGGDAGDMANVAGVSDMAVPGLGIDKVRLSVVAIPNFEAFKASSGIYSGPVLSVVLKLSDGVPVSVRARRISGGWRISVQFNPARVLDPDGWGLCALSRFPDALEVVLGAVSDLIGAGEDEHLGWDVRMVHLARDFTDVGCDHLLRSLVSVQPRYAREKHLWFRIGPVALAETLYVGNKTGKAKAYDKHAETKGVAPEGTLRYELEAGGEWLDSAGILYADDLANEGLVGAFFRERWAWSGFGFAVLGAPAAFVVLNNPDIDVKQRLEFFALFAAEAHGQPPFAGCSEAALKRYGDLKRKFGLVPSFGAFSVASGGSGSRLDLDLGRQVEVPVQPASDSGGDQV